MSDTVKRLFGSAIIIVLLSNAITIFVIFLWGSVANMLTSAANLDFHPHSFYVSLVSIVLAASIIYLYIFCGIRRRKIFDLNVDESDYLFLLFIGGFIATTCISVPASVCFLIDYKTDILPFAREIGLPPVQHFILISGFNVIAISVLVVLSRHYTLRSEAGSSRS